MAVTVLVLVVVIVVLARELYAPAPTMLAALVLLVIVQAVSPAQAFAGFSSSATITIAGLFVVARALQLHGGLGRLLARALGSGGSHRRSLVRLLAPVMLTSTVIANTPLVATLGPMVRTWAERQGRPASRYLMPLSFAALLGGVVTAIGTSTTLVVSGLMQTGGLPPLDLFEMVPVGLPVAIIGGVVLVALAPRVLPDRSSSVSKVASHERDYTFRLQVAPGAALVGQDVAASGLRNLDEVFLAGVRRRGLDLTPVPPTTVLQANDVLTFVGRVDHVLEVTERAGLVHADETQATLLEGDGHGLVEAVVGANSPLTGRTPKEVSFRGRYGAAIVAIHRQGERIDAKLGEVQLQVGDALLLMTDQDFEERWRASRDFAIVVPLEDQDGGPSRRRLLVGGVALAMVAAAAVGVPLLTAVLAACLVLVGTRTLGFWEARGALDGDVLLIVASAIGLGGAMAETGVAGLLGEGIESVAMSSNATVALLAVLLGTLVLTELVTNVAAAGLMVPVALDVAQRIGSDPRGWAVGVAIMASASFLTPIGYQTNTIVYALGGYRFGDYWRLGLPLTLIVLATASTVIPAVYF